jgi:hypothetical protein
MDTTIGAEAVRDLAAGGATSFAAGGQQAPVCASRRLLVGGQAGVLPSASRDFQPGQRAAEGSNPLPGRSVLWSTAGAEAIARAALLSLRHAQCTVQAPFNCHCPAFCLSHLPRAGLSRQLAGGALTKFKLDNSGIVSVLYEQVGTANSPACVPANVSA